MRPVRCGGVQRNLEEDDHQSVDREQHTVERGGKMKILYEKQRQRTFVLEENRAHKKGREKKHEQSPIGEHRSAGFAKTRVFGLSVEISRARCAFHRNSDEKCARCKRRQSVDEKDRA